jgi:hypothetical protein
MMISRRVKYIIAAGLAVAAAAIAAAFLSGEGASQKGEKPGPEGVVSGFVSAMKSGDFEAALALCDSASMHEHMHAYMQKWQEACQKDSASFCLMTEMLAGTTIEFEGMTEEDGMCHVGYKLAMDDNEKVCRATLRKEEGEWKIVEITDKL